MRMYANIDKYRKQQKVHLHALLILFKVLIIDWLIPISNTRYEKNNLTLPLFSICIFYFAKEVQKQELDMETLIESNITSFTHCVLQLVCC